MARLGLVACLFLVSVAMGMVVAQNWIFDMTSGASIGLYLTVGAIFLSLASMLAALAVLYSVFRQPDARIDTVEDREPWKRDRAA